MDAKWQTELLARRVGFRLNFRCCCDLLCKQSSAIWCGWCVEVNPDVPAVVLVIGAGDSVGGPTVRLCCIK
jgi:hypothetical protein